MLSYHRFDPNLCRFPRARVAALPPPTAAQITWRASACPDPTLEIRNYARGRYALRAAFELCGAGPGTAVLLPAYHCRTMVDAALSLGAEVVLYPVTPTLAPDMAGLQTVAARCASPPCVLLLTHYFGVLQDAATAASFCADRGIALVEDCSHVLAPVASERAGRTGRYATSSPYKFFPAPDGGWLWSAQGAPLPFVAPASRPASAELRAAARVLQQLVTRRPPPKLESIETELTAGSSLRRERGRDWIEPGGVLSSDWHDTDALLANLRVSQWLVRHIDLEGLRRRRRMRHVQWAEAVAALPGCDALWPDLPPDCTPYMFALRVDRPLNVFYPLKHLGMPIWRWDDIAASDCSTAQRYRLGLLHLPCHQALSDDEMAWMTAAVAQVLRMA